MDTSLLSDRSFSYMINYTCGSSRTPVQTWGELTSLKIMLALMLDCHLLSIYCQLQCTSFSLLAVLSVKCRMYQSVRTYVIISQYDLLNVHNLLSQHLCDIDSLFKNPCYDTKTGKRKRHQIWCNHTCCSMRHTHMLLLSLTHLRKSLCITFMLIKGQIPTTNFIFTLKLC